MSKLALLCTLLISSYAFAGHDDDIFPDQYAIIKRMDYVTNTIEPAIKKLGVKGNASLFGQSLEHLLVLSPDCDTLKKLPLTGAYEVGIISFTCRWFNGQYNLRDKEMIDRHAELMKVVKSYFIREKKGQIHYAPGWEADMTHEQMWDLACKDSTAKAELFNGIRAAYNDALTNAGFFNVRVDWDHMTGQDIVIKLGHSVYNQLTDESKFDMLESLLKALNGT